MRGFIALLACLLLHTGITAQVLDITNFGAIGDGTTVNTTAIQAAVDSCNKLGGGTVEVPAGNFVTGTIFLKSNVTIHISLNGTISGSMSLVDYPDVHPKLRTITDGYPQKSVFYAEGQHNIAITGEGTFNGNGNSAIFYLTTGSANRPYGFRIISCSNVRYEGLKLRHSAFWMMHNLDIDTLVIKNLNIINQSFGNNDGVNIDGCRKVLVDSIYADCNDDPMVIKTTSLKPCSDVEIKNSTVATYSRGIKIGTETFANISNIHIHDCKVIPSTAGPFKSPAKIGLNIATVNGSHMQNVRCENIDMTGIHTPFVVRLGNQPKRYTDTAAYSVAGSMRDIELRNITAVATSDTTSSVSGIANYKVKNIVLSNIDITYPGGWPALPPYYPLPESENERPEATLFGDTLPASGLYIRHVDSIRLQNVCFHAINPDGRPDVFTEQVSNLDTTGICGRFVMDIPAANQNHTFSIFPNPVNDRFAVTVSREGAILTICDLAGRRIEAIQLDTAGLQWVNVAQLAKGTYILHVTDGFFSFTSKFVKL